MPRRILRNTTSLLSVFASKRSSSARQQDRVSKNFMQNLRMEPLEERQLLFAAGVDDGMLEPAPLTTLDNTEMVASEAGADVSYETASYEMATLSVVSQSQSGSVWISREEVMSLPTSGKAWDTLVSAAKGNISSPDISNQDEKVDTTTLAKALVGVRTDNQQYINEVRNTIMKAIDTEDGGRTLALGRNQACYIIAADLVGLSSSQDATFRAWLRETLDENLDGKTLTSTHEDRPNNWGTMAGASRAAIAVYLGDQAEIERTAQVFKGWLGDRSAYAGFDYGDLSWQADPDNPVGINPKGAMKDGHSIDGALPDDMRRGGSFKMPPASTGYPWEGLQGAVVQAEILYRAGYDAWQWEDQALLRATEFLYGLGWEAEGDDEWIPFLVDAHYGTNYADNPAASAGKVMAWTAWTHQNGAPSAQSMTMETYSMGDFAAYSVAAETETVAESPTASAELLLVDDATAVEATSDGNAVDAAIESFSGDLLVDRDFATSTESEAPASVGDDINAFLMQLKADVVSDIAQRNVARRTTL